MVYLQEIKEVKINKKNIDVAKEFGIEYYQF
jgi:hypothetical protein